MKEPSIKEKIKLAIETYNKYSEIYTEHTKDKLLQFQLARFVSLLPNKGKVLDAGCGCGRDAAYLQHELGIEVAALEISKGMINEAKKLKVNAIKCDLLNLKSKEEFDGVWCMATLADIPKEDSVKFLKNLNKSLKENGIIYLAVKEGKGEHLLEKERYGNSKRFYSFYTKEELNKLLKENNFEIIESSVSNDNGTNWIEVFAKKL